MNYLFLILFLFVVLIPFNNTFAQTEDQDPKNFIEIINQFLIELFKTEQKVPEIIFITSTNQPVEIINNNQIPNIVSSNIIIPILSPVFTESSEIGVKITRIDLVTNVQIKTNVEIKNSKSEIIQTDSRNVSIPQKLMSVFSKEGAILDKGGSADFSFDVIFDKLL